MKQFSALIASVLVVPVLSENPARAQGFFLEPWIGYEAGELDYGSHDDHAMGLVYGVRFAYMSGRIGLGVEYATGAIEVDSEPEDDFEIRDFGASLLYNFGAARLWATYIFDAKGDLDTAREAYRDGTGMRFGIGFLAGRKFNLSIEKVERKFEKVNSNRVVPTRQIDALVFSLGMPLM